MIVLCLASIAALYLDASFSYTQILARPKVVLIMQIYHYIISFAALCSASASASTVDRPTLVDAGASDTFHARGAGLLSVKNEGYLKDFGWAVGLITSRCCTPTDYVYYSNPYVSVMICACAPLMLPTDLGLKAVRLVGTHARQIGTVGGQCAL